MTPSPQQESIRLFIESPAAGNLIISATAGSGKTTTLCWVQQYIQKTGLLPPSILFLAFNKSIVETLKQKVPSSTQVATCHAHGLRALKESGIIESKVKVDGGKCRALVYNRTGRENPDAEGIVKLVSLCKSLTTEATTSDCKAFIAHHDLSFDEENKAVALALDVLAASNRDLKTIDFDDMLYLPIRHNAKFTKQDWIFVDEAQDTNDIQLEIISRLCKNPIVPMGDPILHNAPLYNIKARPSPTRLVFVGDPYQAIYGFRGANSDSMEKIKERFGCHELPLSVSYRCSKAVVAEALKVFTP